MSVVVAVDVVAAVVGRWLGGWSQAVVVEEARAAKRWIAAAAAAAAAAGDVPWWDASVDARAVAGVAVDVALDGAEAAVSVVGLLAYADLAWMAAEAVEEVEVMRSAEHGVPSCPAVARW